MTVYQFVGNCNSRSKSLILLTVVICSLILPIGVHSADVECVYHSDCDSDESCYAGKCVYTGERIRDDADMKLYLVVPLCVGVPFVVLVLILIICCFRNSHVFRKKYGLVIDASSLEKGTKGSSTTHQHTLVGQVNPGYPQPVMIVTPVVLSYPGPGTGNGMNPYGNGSNPGSKMYPNVDNNVNYNEPSTGYSTKDDSGTR